MLSGLNLYTFCNKICQIKYGFLVWFIAERQRIGRIIDGIILTGGTESGCAGSQNEPADMICRRHKIGGADGISIYLQGISVGFTIQTDPYRGR